MPSTNVKIVVFVPESHSNIVREAIGKAGGGRIGNYTFCSFSSKGTGRFQPGQGSNPSIGSIGRLEEAVEERIETLCSRVLMSSVLAAIKTAHPYEEVAIDVYAIEDM